MPENRVPATLRADCDGREVEFDAATWLETATEAQLGEMRDNDYGGCYAADDAAHYYRDTNPAIDELLTHCELLMAAGVEAHGFAVYLDHDSAELWFVRHHSHVRRDVRPPDLLPVREMVHLVRDLQRLMYAELRDGREIWDPAKQSHTSPADLQQDLELLMRKFDLLPAPTTASGNFEMRAVLSRAGCADLTATVAVQHGTLDIYFPGYSDKNSEFGAVIYIELDEAGHPKLYAWTDIRCEDPTQVLSFARAMDERTVE